MCPARERYLLEFKDTTSSQSLLDPSRLCRFLCLFYFTSSCQPTMTSTTTSPTLAVATLSEILPMMIVQKRSLLFLNRFDSNSFGILTVKRGDLSITTCRFHGISQTYDFSLFTFNQECVLHYTSLQSWEATIHGWKDFQTQKLHAHSIHFESASILGSVTFVQIARFSKVKSSESLASKHFVIFCPFERYENYEL